MVGGDDRDPAAASPPPPPPPPPAARVTSVPPTTRDSLLASARIRPARNAASVAESGRARDAVQNYLTWHCRQFGGCIWPRGCEAVVSFPLSNPVGWLRHREPIVTWTVVARLTATTRAPASSACRASKWRTSPGS